MEHFNPPPSNLNEEKPNTVENTSQPKMNPLLSVWLHPKLTATFVINNISMEYIFFIIAIGFLGATVTGLLDSYLYPDMSVWTIALLLIFISPNVGFISIAISSGVLLLFGKLFKGTATYKQLYKGLSLTSIPFIIQIPFYFIFLFAYPETLTAGNYTEETPMIAIILLIVCIILSLITTVWSFVITVAVVAQVHRFSNWASFFTIIIPAFVFVFLFFILIIVISIIYVTSGFFIDTIKG